MKFLGQVALMLHSVIVLEIFFSIKIWRKDGEEGENWLI